MSDPKDDKANYVYGQKEVWYLRSIESKTMIGFFETSNREDGLGVLGEAGGRNTSLKLNKLDRIKLYSKADWFKNGAAAIPIKVVNFEYDYSLYPGVSNNSGSQVDKNGIVVGQDAPSNVNNAKGKLTLKRIYFTFGTSTRGISNPYDFSYDLRPINDGSLPSNPDPLEANDQYAQRQGDRWGTYKQGFYNHVVNGQGAMNNSEFPYVPQENSNTTYSERALADRSASKWQLNKIVTPTGSTIAAEYESDDYAFVQNRRAMQMCFVKGINTIYIY